MPEFFFPKDDNSVFLFNIYFSCLCKFLVKELSVYWHLCTEAEILVHTVGSTVI